MIEHSLVMVKPHAFATKRLGIIVSMLEQNDFRVVGLKSVKLTHELARKFYFVHEDKPFFEELIQYMSSDTIAAILVQKENCVKELRQLIGHTDPTQAKVGTIRRTVGESVAANGVHASDCLENAKKEIRFFFSDIELYSFEYLDF